MERDLVLFSATRSNSMHSLGFLSDARRMNVMLTRARRGVIVFGNSETLRSSQAFESRWRDWIEWIESRGAVLSSASLTAPSLVDAKITNDIAKDHGTKTASTQILGVDREQKQSHIHLPTHEKAVTDISSPPPPPQPPTTDWQRVYSEQHGLHYYWDRVSNATQWERPNGFINP